VFNKFIIDRKEANLEIYKEHPELLIDRFFSVDKFHGNVIECNKTIPKVYKIVDYSKRRKMFYYYINKKDNLQKEIIEEVHEDYLFSNLKVIPEYNGLLPVNKYKIVKIHHLE
jgi:hypothetical protein